jgi:hypothetical protein
VLCWRPGLNLQIRYEKVPRPLYCFLHLSLTNGQPLNVFQRVQVDFPRRDLENHQIDPMPAAQVLHLSSA